eukprot:CAMPEP_0116565450 /NCGR_PEP_ID=MMETSP0397-20121206/13906_1 /TAXON_ID=216820 /ORGANISM="Cyclophora tenuis, Strain ECT3854" /LENGTH=313 /DNA_ID=CAMNT_0004092227 /DNA_START=71 /DNA_END=1012 /DNA_ORIENTATION=+
MILSETIPKLLVWCGVAISRTQALFSVTLGVLLPLCLMKQLKSLAPFSLVGILGMMWTATAMTLRYLDGSYSEGGALLESVPDSLRPDIGTDWSDSILPVLFSTKTFVLISMLSTSCMAHYNAPKFYIELRDRTLPRFYRVVGFSSAISLLIFGVVMTTGYLTFGKNCAGLVLTNYSSKDVLMSIGRICVAVSLVCSYPLAFVGVRDGVLDLVGVKESQRKDGLLNMVTIALLSVITGLACVIRDLRLILAFGGATWGNFVTYPFPVLMFLKCVHDQRRTMKMEVPLAATVGILGLLMGIIGARSAVEMAMGR